MARKSIDPGALIAPVPPLLVSCGTLEKPNVMTAAWTGIINTKPPRAYVSIRPERCSYEIIKNTKALVLNLTTVDMAEKVDFCGVRSGKTVDKCKICAFTPVPSSTVSAPSIDESPLCLECRVTDILPQGSHDLFLLDITAVTVKEELFDQNGRLALDKAGLLAYAHGEYFALGKKCGSFGFSVRKKKKTASLPSSKKDSDTVLVTKKRQKSTHYDKKTANTPQKKRGTPHAHEKKHK